MWRPIATPSPRKLMVASASAAPGLQWIARGQHALVVIDDPGGHRSVQTLFYGKRATTASLCFEY